MAKLRIGSCSWKYPSWEGLVYSAPKGIDHLQEYAKQYDTVEVDQWFWSLFEGKPPRLPVAKDVQDYRRAVSDSFRFTVKAPNSLTLTHHYRTKAAGALQVNDYFFSPQLWRQFSECLAPLHDVAGPLIFQFEYLNRQKMASLKEFLGQLQKFKSGAGNEWLIGVETRNGNYVNESYFSFLIENKLVPVLLQGYWMPAITDVCEKYRAILHDAPVIVLRLHGPDRDEIEKETGGEWNRLVHDRGQELSGIAGICRDLLAAGVDVYVNINNHYEGSAPITIERLKKL